MLAPLLKEPNMARYAIAEEFRDRIWKASDAKEQWRISLGERKIYCGLKNLNGLNC